MVDSEWRVPGWFRCRETGVGDGGRSRSPCGRSVRAGRES